MNIRDIDNMINDHKHRRLTYFNLQTVFYFKYIKNPRLSCSGQTFKRNSIKNNNGVKSYTSKLIDF